MIKRAIDYPVSTAVGVILAVLFGGISLFRIPIQLIPTVVEPIVTVTTIWPGASPHEVEREITIKQEDELKNIAGLVKMDSSSQDSTASITLKFQTGTDLNSMFVQVSNRLEQVQSYPDDVEKPIIAGVDANATAMAWFLLRPGGPEPFNGDISTLHTFVENVLQPAVERVPGVAQSNAFGGREQQMQVIVDPGRLAAAGVTYNQLAASLEAENRNYSGGDFIEGKRRYVVRTVGEYLTPQDIENVVITIKDGVPIYVRDVATAKLDYQKTTSRVYYKGTAIIVMNAIRQQGANVMEAMAELHKTIGALNQDILAPRGLEIVLVFDETEYIDSAISLVQQNLLFGGFLAIMVLLLFLRSGTSTLVIAVAIPISAIATFLMMNLFGRSINVISLAGMAFAVGMVVDNSIVVLENIYRHLQMGKTRAKAALDGAGEVWGAVLASTLTTIAVFLPIFFIEEEAGQLFRDIAIAISCAVALSLIVSVTVIPSFSAKILRGSQGKTRTKLKRLGGLVALGGRISNGITGAVYWICGGVSRQLMVVFGLTGVAILVSFLLMPKAEYLPTGNQNFLFGTVLPPPGYSVEENRKIGQNYERDLAYLWEAENGDPSLPGGGIEDFFTASMNGLAFMGVSSHDPERVRELLPVFMEANSKVPGTIAFTTQASIFQTSFGSSRSIEIEIMGPQLETLIGLGGRVFGMVQQLMPGAQARPIPSLDLGNPEIKILTHRQRAAELGITNRELGFAVSALVDGAKASEFRHEGHDIDLRVMAPESIGHRTHLLEQMPIASADGEMVTLGSLAELSVVTGPVQIDHKERQRAITVQVTPPEEMPLQDAMELIQNQILEPMVNEGLLGGIYRTRLSGTADKLTQTGAALKWNFILAIVITYLLLAALFESFLYPFVILFSVPLAAMGGFLGLTIVNLWQFQALDVLTMLGFIILVGTVVNNAILIVHQSLIHWRDEGLSIRNSIKTATGTRIRPIFMSVSTSVFGMLPLVLFPGAGSELYRGLGSVVVGGLVVSTIFTLFLVPALLSLCLQTREALFKTSATSAQKGESAA